MNKKSRHKLTGIQYLACPLVQLATKGEGDDDEQMVVSGVGIEYGKRFQRWSDLEFEMESGCFGDLADVDVRMLLSHNYEMPLGRTASGTLKLTDSPEALAYRCLLPDSPFGQNVFASVKRKDTDGASVGFNIKKSEETYDDDGMLVLIAIKEAKLFEISLTHAPVYEHSSAEAGNDFADGAPARSRQAAPAII